MTWSVAKSPRVAKRCDVNIQSINTVMWKFVEERARHSKKQSSIQSTFMPSAPSRDPNNGPPACLSSGRVYLERRGTGF
ncbi:hypothetical protein TNCV_2859131 [Trichonephila clavipes]|nr:hypothetical protein TNCV_2859131 [Trichonephila clavipes]